MNKKYNPFLLKGYVSKNLFCNRENEVEKLTSNVFNGIDTTLISPRRMGKTGLIFRFFEDIEEKEGILSIYIDIFPSRDLSDFIKILAEATLHRFPEKTAVGKRFLELIKGFRPLISYDPLTGNPQIQIMYQSVQEKEYTLRGLIHFLNNQQKQIVVAIDEFQQIAHYPEKNVEAILRTYTQNLENIRFIFCGSNKTMMVDIFSDVKRPFFASTQYLTLAEIDKEAYAAFIREKFEQGGMTLEDEALEMIFSWSLRHTFYTQSLCNMTYSMGKGKVTIETVKAACVELLKRSEPVFLQYRQLLTVAQWNFLIAVAKEGEVKRITTQKFIADYGIGTPANSRRIAQALTEKELLLKISDKNETVYRIYDVFLSRWLENEY